MAWMMSSSSHARITRVMVVLGVSFLGYLAYQSWAALTEVLATTGVSVFMGAILLLALANVSVAVLFAAMLVEAGKPVAVLRRVASVFLVTQLGKYLPGKIWSVVAQVSTLGNVGSPGRVVIVNIELAIIVVVTTCGIGGALLLAQHHGVVIGLTALVIVFALTATMVRTALVHRAIRRILSRASRLKKRPIFRDAELGAVRRGMVSLAALAGFWAMYLMGWWLLVESLPGVPGVGTGLVVACLSLSYVAGLASMLPAGLGVREAALVLLAPVSGVPFELMALLAVASRAALILVDAIGAIIGFFAVKASEDKQDA